MLRFLLPSGWREGEALAPTWSQIDIARGVATLPDTKTGRSVRELGAPALAVLDAMRAYQRAGSPYVLPGAKPGAHYADTARYAHSVEPSRKRAAGAVSSAIAAALAGRVSQAADGPQGQDAGIAAVLQLERRA